LTFRNWFSSHACRDLELPQIARLGQLLGLQQDLALRTHGGKEFHPADGGEQEERSRLLWKSRRGRDPGSLREGLGQNNPGNEGIAGEMTGKDRVVVRENS
jgi:hypothetical protein